MKEELATAVQTACKEVFNVEVKIELTRPDEQFGDYATNVALQLAKQVGKNPREIADSLAEKLRTNELLADVQVAGPGFLNVKLKDEILYRLATSPHPTPLKGKKMLVEYSDPNPFKPLHAGHLYTTLVGDVLSRLLEASGAEVVRINYGGDVGLHVAKTMWAIVKYLGGEHPEKLSDIPEAERSTWMGACYAKGHIAYEDGTAKQEITEYNRRVYEIHQTNDHESTFAKIYWACREWSYTYFQVLYTQLEVVPFDRFLPESEVTQLGIDTVQEQLEKGVYQKSDGAVIFDGEEYGLHTRVFINSEGLPTYEAKDVGLSLTKWRDYHFDQSIIITAAEQAQYMQVVIKSIAQFAPESAERTRHFTHGTVKLRGGVKMSSRKGNVVMALEILDAARQAAKTLGVNSDEHSILAAVKYAFSRVRIGGDIIYDPKESVAMEGNSGPYLQYAHARARSIVQKAKTMPDLTPTTLEAGERGLLYKVGEYTEILERATNELAPHHICTYLHELAQVFNSFYEHNRVIDDPRETTRLGLVKAYADTLRDGLGLLGIHAPDKM